MVFYWDFFYFNYSCVIFIDKNKKGTSEEIKSKMQLKNEEIFVNFYNLIDINLIC